MHAVCQYEIKSCGKFARGARLSRQIFAQAFGLNYAQKNKMSIVGGLIFSRTGAVRLVEPLTDICLLAVICIFPGCIDAPMFTLSP
ncbi:MAG TPA: hypothetical protein VK211_06715 [Kamptonema sp.]|nr:hypothetical protein [Kamptonema sp.]